MLFFFRFLRGFLRVRFTGDFSEKILNIAAANRIIIWNTKLVKTGIETNILVKDFYSLPRLLKGKNTKVHILKRCGLRFQTEKYKNRIGIITGVILMALILSLLSQRIWVIEVVGNKTVKSREIIEICNQIGIKNGILKKDINPKKYRQKLLLESEKLSWAALNIEGCRLTVNVSEVKKIDNKNDASNLKATADGIIKKINISSGNCLVKTGDTVKKGDVLVSGIIEKLNSTEMVKSSGEIIAETTRSITVKGNFEKMIKEKNGKYKKKVVVSFFNFKIPLFLGKENREYVSCLEERSLKLFSTELPIKLYRRTFFFVDTEKLKISEEKLRLELKEKVKEELLKEQIKNFEILSEEFITSDRGIELTALIRAEENIAHPENIIINNENS